MNDVIDKAGNCKSGKHTMMKQQTYKLQKQTLKLLITVIIITLINGRYHEFMTNIM